VYEPLSPETLENPYPLYARLRETAPIFWHEQMSSWVVTRHADCVEVLREHNRFARDRRRVGVDVPENMQNLQSLDPPQLSPLKRVLVGAFRNQDLPAIGKRTHVLAERLLGTLADRTEFDWIHEVAAPLALAVSADLFGVPEPGLDYYAAISDAIARRMDGGLNPANIPAGDTARAELNRLVDGWLAADERPGILSAVRRNADRAGLPAHYIRNSASNMFNASYGTLFAAIGNVCLTLLEHPDVLAQLRSDHTLLDTAPDELVRFDGPAQGTSRLAVEDTELCGQPIRSGQIVMTLFGAANRDPEEFANPENVVLSRSPNRHLGFGWGVHSCLGTMFGNLAISELLRALMDAPDLRLVGQPTRRTTATVRSMDLLPVAFRG
jgi:cytochrome P450